MDGDHDDADEDDDKAEDDNGDDDNGDDDNGDDDNGEKDDDDPHDADGQLQPWNLHGRAAVRKRSQQMRTCSQPLEHFGQKEEKNILLHWNIL